MKLRFVALIGVMSLAGLGLIGAGAHAVWSTTTTARQQITSSAAQHWIDGASRCKLQCH